MLKKLLESKCNFCKQRLECLAEGCSQCYFNGFIIPIPDFAMFQSLDEEAKELGFSFLSNVTTLKSCWSKNKDQTAVRVSILSKNIAYASFKFYKNNLFEGYVFIRS